MLFLLSLLCVFQGQVKVLENVKSLYSRWNANAMLLNSGIVEISGRENRNGINKSINIHISFDYLNSAEFISFLWADNLSGTWCRKKNNITYIEPHGKIINIVNSHDVKLKFIKPYDIRFLPLATLYALQHGIDSKDEWSTIQKLISASAVRLHVHSDRQVSEFLFSNIPKAETEERRLEVDFNLSQSPLINGFRLWRKKIDSQDWLIVMSSNIKYNFINGINVPVELLLNDKSSGSEIILRLKWSKVNEPIDDSAFDTKNFPIRETVLLIDSRASTSKPVIIGNIEPSNIKQSEVAEEPLRFSPTTKFLIALVCIIGVFSTIYVAIRIAKRRPPAPTI
jgi:hypothetical protein